MSVTLTGTWQDGTGAAVSNGTLILQLSQSAVLINTTQVAPSLILILLDSTGSISTSAPKIYGNDSLAPAGTVYFAKVVNSNGQTVWSPTQGVSIGGSSFNFNTALPTSSGVILANAVLQNPSGPQTITGFGLTLATSAPLTVNGAATFSGTSSFTGAVTAGGVIPPSAGGADIGATTLPWANLWIGAAATNNIKLTGTATGARIATLPDNTGTIAELNLAQTWTANNNFTGGLQVNGVPVAGSGFTGVNVTPVTANASVTTDQNGMAITITAGSLNFATRTLLIQLAGVYSTAAASTATITDKIKLCTVSGCGSGTVLTLATWTTPALAGVTVSNNPYNVTINASTQTAGASAAFEVHGNLVIDLSALAAAAESIFADNNTATIGTIDSTAQLFLQHTRAFSAASTSNSFTDRQLIADTVD